MENDKTKLLFPYSIYFLLYFYWLTFVLQTQQSNQGFVFLNEIKGKVSKKQPVGGLDHFS